MSYAPKKISWTLQTKDIENVQIGSWNEKEKHAYSYHDGKKATTFHTTMI